jgi:hypothetical protein
VIRRGALAAIALTALVLAAPSPAAAEAVSGPELIALAEQAAGDDAARERLLSVDEVDGRPVAVGAALIDARGAELADRARLIAALAQDAPEGTPADDRRAAHDVLDDRRYEGSSLPRPLEGPFAWIGDRVQPVIDWLNERGTSLPGGTTALWTLLAVLFILVSTTFTTMTIQRRALAIERARAAATPDAEDPAALERAAEQAERDGEFERAVRLRFRAGLLRLDRRHVLVYRPSLTTGEVARTIDAPAFADVGTRFDEIAYGGRPAEREDAEASQRGWRDVLAEVGHR